MELICAALYTAYLTSAAETWAAARNATSAAELTETSARASVDGAAGEPPYRIRRGIISYDTSLLPANARVKSAHITGEGYVQHDIEAGYVALVEYTGDLDPANLTDFPLFGETDFGHVTLPDSSASYEIDLNAAGRAKIVRGGTTRYGFRCQMDYEDVDPGAGATVNRLGNTELVITYVLDEVPSLPGHPTILSHPSHRVETLRVPSAAADMLFGTGAPYSLFYEPPPVPPTPPPVTPLPPTPPPAPTPRTAKIGPALMHGQKIKVGGKWYIYTGPTISPPPSQIPNQYLEEQHYQGIG